MTRSPLPPPATFWRVEWDEGYGWPDCTHRERTARNFTTVAAAVRQILTLRQWPDHHRLVSVWTGRAEWTRLTDDERDALIEEVSSGWNDEPGDDGEAAARPRGDAGSDGE